MDDTGKIAELDADQTEAINVEPEKTILCKTCAHEITKPSLAIQPHEHTFTNPMGMVFNIACYKDAPGAASFGMPTKVATWFPGYAWSLAICLECKSHIGWWFEGDGKFAGLIVDRLLR